MKLHPFEKKKKWWQDRFQDSIPNFIYKLIVYIINTIKSCEVYSKSTIKTPAQHNDFD